MIYIVLMFFEEIHSMKMSQQTIWQILCNSGNTNNTHTHTHTYTNTHTHTHTHLESLHIFLQSNYKLVTWIKRFVKVYSSSFICVSSGIWIPIKCNMTVNSISINHQNSIAKTPFTHCISLRRYVFFFFCMLN